MGIYSKRINENYAFELLLWHIVRQSEDGIIFVKLDISLDLYKCDHTPKFDIILILLNLTIIKFSIYTMNHIDRIDNIGGA